MKFMNWSALRLIAIFALCLVGFACNTERTIVWSPDGKRATVVGTDGLYLSDSEGRLSALLLPGVHRAVWADDQTILVVRPKKAESWKELSALMEPAEQDEVEDLAQRIKRLILTSVLPADAFFQSEEFRQVTAHQRSALFLAALYILKDDPEVTVRGGDAWQEQAKKLELGRYWTLHRVAVDAAGKLTESGQVGRTLSEIMEVVPGPKAIAFVTNEGGLIGQRLYLQSGKETPKIVSDHVAMYPGFSRNGDQLYFMRSNVPTEDHNALTLGVLARVGIADEEMKADELVSLLFDNSAKVRELPDGKLVFSGARVSLPATRGNMPEKQELFFIHPDDPAEVQAVGGNDVAEVLRDDTVVQMFEVSPNGARIAIPTADGQMLVVNTDSGQVTRLEPVKGEKVNVAMHPSWKGNILCFGVKPEEKGKPARYFLWDGTATREIGTAWPENVKVRPE